MESSTLIQAIRERPHAVRREALAALISELTSHEWRYLRRLLNARTFQHDIVGELPVELVVRVFANLDIGAPYRLQAVSRKWGHALRSADLIKPRLRAWYGETSPPAIRLADDYDYRAQKAEHVFRISTGRPYSSLTIPTRKLPIQSTLVDDTLAWVSDIDDRAISVCNLRTGKTWRAQTPGREMIRNIVASEELIAFTTHTICYVKTLDGLQSNQFRLISPLWNTTACRGQYVVCASGSFNPAASGIERIYIWDFNTSRGQSFEVDICGDVASNRKPPSTPIAILPDPKTKTVVIFSYCCYVYGRGTDKPAIDLNDRTVYYSRFSFSGELIRYGKQAFPNFVITSFRGLFPAATQGRSTLRVVAVTEHNWKTSEPQVVHLEFDEHSDTFLEPRLPATSVDDGELYPGIVSWNDVYYQVVFTKIRFRTFATVCLGTISEPVFRGLESAAERRLSEPVGEPLNDQWLATPTARLHVNENYAVTLTDHSAGRSEINVYSFERGLQLPKEAIEAFISEQEA